MDHTRSGVNSTHHRSMVRWCVADGGCFLAHVSLGDCTPRGKHLVSHVRFAPVSPHEDVLSLRHYPPPACFSVDVQDEGRSKEGNKRLPQLATTLIIPLFAILIF